MLTGKKTTYNAFISYASDDPSDSQFVRELIDYLEVRKGLRLCVPERNILPGAAENSISAYIIEER